MIRYAPRLMSDILSLGSLEHCIYLLSTTAFSGRLYRPFINLFHKESLIWYPSFLLTIYPCRVTTLTCSSVFFKRGVLPTLRFANKNLYTVEYIPHLSQGETYRLLIGAGETTTAEETWPV